MKQTRTNRRKSGSKPARPEWFNVTFDFDLSPLEWPALVFDFPALPAWSAGVSLSTIDKDTANQHHKPQKRVRKKG